MVRSVPEAESELPPANRLVGRLPPVIVEVCWARTLVRRLLGACVAGKVLGGVVVRVDAVELFLVSANGLLGLSVVVDRVGVVETRPPNEF